MIQIEKYLELEPPRRQVLDALDEGRNRIWVVDKAGSGGTKMASDLAGNLKESAAVAMLPPADDVDAPIHGLYQLASYLEADTRRSIIEEEPGTSLGERARLVAQKLLHAGRILILVAPASWRTQDAKDDAEGHARASRARELIDGLLGEASLPTVIFSSANLYPPSSTFKPIQLPLLHLPPSVLEDATGSDRYVEAAHALQTALERRSLRITPVQIRLAVGVIALGDRADDVVGALETPGRPGHSLSNPMPLARRLLEQLETTECQGLRAGLRRLAQSRYPLPRNTAIALAGLPDEHRSLIVDCVGSGDDTVHLLEHLRHALLRGLSGEDRYADAHDALAEYHETQDGARDPSALPHERTLHWLEKVHHSAHGSASSRRKWYEQSLRARDFHWELAWSLSVEERDYGAAAEVYRAVLDQFGPDGYTCHYLAYNLDHAGKEPNVVEDMYRRAVEMDPANPWWNSRLVTFLIDQARFRAARAEWSEALERVDPEGVRVANSPWLAKHLHVWVVMAWLEYGQVEPAREAFDVIPAHVVENDDQLKELKLRLEDAKEAEALGESVYPASTPMKDRWRGPRVVPGENHSGAVRVAWYPGRIVDAAEDGVTLVVATPEQDRDERRVIARQMTREEWLESARFPPEQAKGFVEVGSFADGTVQILPLPPEIHSPVFQIDSEWRLRYLRQW
jgi:hypothetical protein